MIQFPTTLADNPVALALTHTKVVVTLKSLKTGEHLTLKLTAKAKRDDRSGYDKVSTLDEATHVFINDYNDWQNKAGTFYPRSGKFYSADHASPVLVFAAEQVLQFITQGTHHRLVEIDLESRCLRCNIELQDPTSIERGFGPECYGIVTGSKHVSRSKRQPTRGPAADPDPVAIPDEGDPEPAYDRRGRRVA
jgi:hypothetical protein